MQKQKKIIIEIDPKGDCSIDGEGFVGPECATFIGEIEKSLGHVTSRRNKKEFKQKRTVVRKIFQKGGR